MRYIKEHFFARYRTFENLAHLKLGLLLADL